MPPQTIQNQPIQPHGDRFMEHLIRFLMPFFATVAPNVEEARAEILETLASYGARTRQEFLHAAQIIAFGLSTLEALAEAKATDMAPAMRLRYRGCANSLNRACQQNERALARLRANAVPATAEPLDDLSEGDLQAALLLAQAKIDNARHRLTGMRSPARSPIAGTVTNLSSPSRPALAS